MKIIELEQLTAELNSPMKIVKSGGFVMRVSDDDDMDAFDGDVDDIDECAPENRFSALKEDGVAEGAFLSEFHGIEIEEEIRRRISLLESGLMAEYTKISSAFARIGEYTEAMRKLDSEIENQHRKRIAEIQKKKRAALADDSCLTEGRRLEKIRDLEWRNGTLRTHWDYSRYE